MRRPRTIERGSINTYMVQSCMILLTYLRNEGHPSTHRDYDSALPIASPGKTHTAVRFCFAGVRHLEIRSLSQPRQRSLPQAPASFSGPLGRSTALSRRGSDHTLLCTHHRYSSTMSLDPFSLPAYVLLNSVDSSTRRTAVSCKAHHRLYTSNSHHVQSVVILHTFLASRMQVHKFINSNFRFCITCSACLRRPMGGIVVFGA